MTFHELAAARYSCRSFSAKPVEKEKLELILDAARLAPTGVNFQPFHLLVFNTPEALEKLRQCSPNTFNATTVILTLARPDAAWKNDVGMNMGGVDAAIVVTHMALQACDLGLQTCMVGRFDSRKLRETFGISAELTPILLLPVGYPAEDGTPSARHPMRKSLEELVSYNAL